MNIWIMISNFFSCDNKYKKLYLEEYKNHNELKYWTQKYIKSNNDLVKYITEK